MIRLTSALRVPPAILFMIGSVVLVACGSDGDEPSAREKHTAAQAQKRVATPAAPQADLDLVTAPSTAKNAPVVALKFAVAERPEVGVPVDIRLALIPTEGVQRVVGSFQGSEGLEVKSGGKTPMFEKPEAGTSISHTITVVPNSDGIFSVTATVISDTESTSVSRTFTIPLIAGAGLPASAKTSQNATPAMANAPAAKSRQSP